MQQYVQESTCRAITVVPGKVWRKIKSYSEKLMVVEVTFANGAVGDVHTHAHEQISYCLEGEFDYSVGDAVYHLVPGDTIAVPPDRLHGCVLRSARGRLLDIFTPCRTDFITAPKG